MDYSQLSSSQITAFLSDPKMQAIFSLLTIWSLVWKGFALWRAAKNESKPWFVALLVINSVGILEIVYLFYFSKKKNKTQPQ